MKLDGEICAKPDMYIQDIDDFNICVRLEEGAARECETA